MIYDNVKNIENYRGLPEIYRALSWLAGRKPGELLGEKAVLDGENCFANPGVLTTMPVEKCGFEAHRRYIDIHFTIRGREGISVRDIAGLTNTVSYDESRDIAFYTGAAGATCWLAPGDFLVCWPEDGHRPAMMDEAPAQVDKIVMKVKA